MSWQLRISRKDMLKNSLTNLKNEYSIKKKQSTVSLLASTYLGVRGNGCNSRAEPPPWMCDSINWKGKNMHKPDDLQWQCVTDCSYRRAFLNSNNCMKVLAFHHRRYRRATSVKNGTVIYAVPFLLFKCARYRI